MEVLMQLVRGYDIDGLHLDRIRYPDFSAPGQTPATGANIGNNAASVWRFQEYYGIPHESAPPEPGDPLWAQWWRDQVTNVVRRIYLNAMAVRPKLVVSAALIVYGGGPGSEAAWTAAEAYWRGYQDWRAWLEEGIIDIAIPMNYKRENIAQQAGWYDDWNEWTRNHVYGRGALAGLGIYLNSIEGTLRQTRRALDASGAAGRALLGVNFYAMANPDAAVTGNPHSLPPGTNTPVRGFAEFAAALTTGKSADGSAAYENPEGVAGAVFAEEAVLPHLPWKAAPAKGHLMGYARSRDGWPLDTAWIFVYDAQGRLARTTRTDGSGFFGAVDLSPGEYAVIAVLGGTRQVSIVAAVTPGSVAAVSFP